MSLVDRLESTGERSFAVVGLAKNCGKTTVVNHLIGEWGRRGVRLGLTSIGRDGEPVDLVTRLPKPRIRVEPGTLAVTAEASLADSAAPSRIVRRMGIPSALGELLLVETEGAGLIELSGPSTMDQAREVISLLRESGAERVVLDGALDRLSCGAPSVCGAAVLSCGAVLGSSPETIAEKAAHQVKLFRLPVLVGEGAEVVRRVAASRGRLAAAIDADGNVTPLDGSALTCRGLADALPEGCRWLWAGGGITDSIAGGASQAQRCPGYRRRRRNARVSFAHDPRPPADGRCAGVGAGACPAGRHCHQPGASGGSASGCPASAGLRRPRRARGRRV